MKSIQRNVGCNVLDHIASRRSMLGATAAAGIGSLMTPVMGQQMQKKQKQILQIYLQGGVSQFESWDPKPKTKYGGPFRPIATSVPGVQICELLPHTAKKMHLLSIVRSVNLATNDHGVGRLFMERGRKNGDYPYIGSVASKYLSTPTNTLPGYVHISTRGLSDDSSAFLEAQHGQLRLQGFQAPENLRRPVDAHSEVYDRGNAFRQQLNQQFSNARTKSMIDAYDASFQQAGQLMARKNLFEKQESYDLVRYGAHPFGRNCLLARTLLEEGTTCVKVTHFGYDTHAENFNFHIEQLDEFDRPFATLLGDLEDRGMLDHTLVMIYSEFGRTPKINHRYGRDHWGNSLSVAFGGCGIQAGAVIGSTNAEGTEVADREVDAGHLFHTCLQAVGIDSTMDHAVAGKSIPIGDPAAGPIEELLV
jgi:uncharacterized protein (DUF1501 family)